MEDGRAPANMRSRLIRLACTGLYVSGALALLRWCAKRMVPAAAGVTGAAFPFVKKRKGPSLQILTYHRVNDEHDPFFPATPVDVFEKQMAYVGRRHHVCALDEAVERFWLGDLPDNAVAITFDDGYRDNYLHAFPIVKSLSLPMTIFLATDAIGTGRTLWHDRVFSAFRDTVVPAIREFDPAFDGASLRTVRERVGVMGQVLASLRQVHDDERNRRITELCRILEVRERVEDPELMLTWEDVIDMRGHGVSFGSHTASHPILSRLSRQETVADIERSCAAMERHLGERPGLFAYPNGTKADFTDMTKDVLKASGFRCAVTTEFGVNEPGADRFELKRGRPWEEHLPTFAFKLSWYRLMSSHAA
jgi:peptidoglycan/xylan/chitin deacetylase (PgdA/CDA1 family)